MKTSQVFGIILAVALIIFAVAFPVPEKHIMVSSYSWDHGWTDSYGDEYVGGDAYNYQMEASLKSGYMGGVLAMKSISFVGGLLLLFITLYSHLKCKSIEEQTHLFSDSTKAQTEMLRKVYDALNSRFPEEVKEAVPQDSNSF